MRRNEPPALATWILEHLRPAPRDQDLSRSLALLFYSGRSEAWYWLQVLSICAAAWIGWLRRHAMLLGFALLWSMLVPVWTAFLDRMENNSRLLGTTWQMDWPFSSPAAFGIWAASSFLFLWTGLLLYLFIQTGLRSNPHRKTVLRSFLLRAPLFFPLYFITFLILNLLSYPGPVVDRSTISPLRAFTDVRLWATAIRFPYFLTMLWALWKLGPSTVGSPSDPIVHLPRTSPASSEPFPTLEVDPSTAKRGLTLTASAGVLNAIMAGFLFCRLPDTYTPTVASLLLRAAIYVVLGAVAGIGGAWIYWSSPYSPFKSQAPVPFSVFSLACAAGWIWAPAMVILYDQISPIAALVAMIGAFLLSVGLRATFAALTPIRSSLNNETASFELFAESLYRPPPEPFGYLIAIGLVAGAFALIEESIFAAAALLAFTSFLFAWQKTYVRNHGLQHEHESPRAALRLLCVLLPALLVTTWALLGGVAHRKHAAELAAALAAANSANDDAPGNKSSNSREKSGIGGYESIILWPTPRKKQLILPIPRRLLFAPGSSQPLVIRFDGPYWYFQPPEKQPGPNAHQAHGSPAAMAIRSENSFPLAVEAHQRLGAEIKLSDCREIQVDVEDRDRDPGEITMVVLLSDSASPEKPAASLGGQLVVSNDPGHPNFHPSPSFKALRFLIPEHAAIRKFDEITVELLPDLEHSFVAPQLAIDQFQLFPR